MSLALIFRRAALGALAVLALALPAAAQEAHWTIDAAHSSAQFSIRHMMVSNTKGDFENISGTVTYDPRNPTALKIEATIDVKTINTRNADRDNHLRSPDFFNVAKYPTITFKSKKTEAAGEGKLKVTGDLTLHGVTKEVVLAVEGPTAPTKDPWGNTRLGATASTKLLRSDFGLTWNKVIEAGGVAVGDEVTISLDIELIAKKAEEKKAEEKK